MCPREPRKPRPAPALACPAATIALGFGLARDVWPETWRGLTVAPESRCAPYDEKRDYPYAQSVERDVDPCGLVLERLPGCHQAGQLTCYCIGQTICS